MTPWIRITAGIAILSSAVSAILFTARARKKVTYMLDALEDNETNFRFREDKGMGRRFNRTLNRLRKIFEREKEEIRQQEQYYGQMLFEREKEEIRQQEQYYGQMLDHVQTGIAVIGNDGEHVEYCNAKALALLGVSSLSSIRQLKRINPPLADAFSKVTEGHEEKAGCSNESSTMTFSITASSAEIRGKNVKIVAFNDISSDMEENESASWTRLIRVLTHEIMNTVTPIASLSEALAKYAGDNTGQNTPDMRTGLETIAASSKDLIKFVSSYRDLTHLPFPEKSAFYLKDLRESDETDGRKVLFRKHRLHLHRKIRRHPSLRRQGTDIQNLHQPAQECDTGRSQPHQHHSRNQHRRKCRGQCLQQRHACQQGKPGRDIHTVLHHKTIRHRHRAEYLAADNEDAQRQHQAHRKQRKRNYVYTDVQIIIPRQAARRPVPQAWPPQHHPCPEADCRQTHGI